MEIEDLKGKRIKISKTSITCKDENNKTCGLVRNIKKFMDIRPNLQIDYFGKIRDAGAWGSNLNIIDNIILDGNQLYYFDDIGAYEAYEKYFAGNPDYQLETKHYNERKQIAENMRKIATVIECYIL